MSVVVIGSQGQLGSELCRQLGSKAIALSRQQLDITDPEAMLRTIEELRPAAVINTAAYTLVDKAEDEPELCHQVNAAAVGNLAKACRSVGATLVQVSTDYVFGGEPARREPLGEDAPTSPQGVYARSKLAGEEAAKSAGKYLIIRTCGLYGQRPAGHRAGNFVDTMLRLGRERDSLRIVADQHCTPSYVPHVTAAILRLLSANACGVFHVVNGGATTWFEFAAEIFRQSGLRLTLEPITTEQYGAKAARPRYSVLSTQKLAEATGEGLPPWPEALKAYLQSLA